MDLRDTDDRLQTGPDDGHGEPMSLALEPSTSFSKLPIVPHGSLGFHSRAFYSASSTSSSMSDLDSIFSFRSTTSMTTTTGDPEASYKLITFLQMDDILQPLYAEAILQASPSQVEQILRKLFKHFAKDLRAEAPTKELMSATGFIGRRATNTAHMICSKLASTTGSRSNNMTLVTTVGYLDEHSEDDEESDDSVVTRFDVIIAFLERSEALRTLRTRMQKVVTTGRDSAVRCKPLSGLEDVSGTICGDAALRPPANAVVMGAESPTNGQYQSNEEMASPQNLSPVPNVARSYISQIEATYGVEAHPDTHKVTPSPEHSSSCTDDDLSEENMVELCGLHQNCMDLIMLSFWSKFSETMYYTLAPASQSVEKDKISGGSDNSHLSQGSGLLVCEPERKGKRKVDRQDRAGDDDDDDDCPQKRLKPEIKTSGSSRPRSLACPYRKHDRRKYNRRDHKICADNSWPTMSRMKYALTAVFLIRRLS